jgi:hypothetical protein
MSTYFQQTIITVVVHASLGTVALNVLPQSGKLDGGTPADHTYVIARLPARCGPVVGTASIVSHGAVGGNSAPSTLEFPLAGSVVDCPTAAFTDQLQHGTVVAFDASTAEAHVNGRTIKSYTWSFGDGAKAVAGAPKTGHEYPASPATPPAYTVTLTVTDSEGAISEHVTRIVGGSASTVTAARTADGTHIRASGKVLPLRSGQDVAVSLLRKEPGGFQLVKKLHDTLSTASRFSVLFKRPAPGTCQVVVTYVGDAARIGSQDSTNTPC